MRTTTVIIGAGHAGLAMSRHLTARSIDHVVLERGEVAAAWRKRWDSLRLLTPNWQTRLPGKAYRGPDPEGFMHRDDVVDFLRRYACHIDAPIRTHTDVQRVAPIDGGYQVQTSRGALETRCVVLASGACALPRVPTLATALPADLTSVHAMHYRRPEQLPDGGVLVVGASATGVQLARELQRSGRPVTLAVGHHVRMPRSYRGRDSQWWMQHSGIADSRYDEVDDLMRARAVSSPQLIGEAAPTLLDLNALADMGVRLAGKLAGFREGRALFSGSLANACKLADLKLNRLLTRLDAWAQQQGLADSLEPAQRFAPTRLPATPLLDLHLGRAGIRSVLWATGFVPDYRYLDVPVFDPAGRLRHEGGVIAAPGLYLMGGNFMRRRKSSFIHGAGEDAAELSAHLHRYVGSRALAWNAAPCDML
ncbi:MAG: NAD(P)-binding domain-containing protein [Myxococcales bacterium]|nr:NAD(P)-binding domain-containing protein [Myxococcales bacterium]